MDWYWIAVGIAVVVLLPGYLYLCSKYVQVGKMAGTSWFVGRKKETCDGKRQAAE